MDKFQILGEMLDKAYQKIELIKPMVKDNPSLMEFLANYQNALYILKNKAFNKQIEPYEGARLGLLRWLSDYDALPDYNDLHTMIYEIEVFYRKEF